MAFQKAVKYDAKLRLSIAGPSGSGKTFTALTLATALAEGQPIAFIDTERGSASKYADMFSFDVMELDNFHPNNFVAGIHDAEQAGYAVLVIDSLTHAWNGTGGLLDIVDGIAKRKYRDNTFAAWKDATPIQNALIDAITASSLHIIVTMRSKQDYTMETGTNGKSTPKKVGMAPIQKDGMEYEFDVVVDMDIDNTMIVQKSRCSQLAGAVIPKPDKKVIAILKPWLNGVARPEHASLATKEQSTNPAPVSTPTKSSTPIKTEPPAENKKLSEIPTVSQLKKDIAELQPKMKGNVMIWPDILAYVFKKSIDEGLLSLDGLVRAGDQLLPEHCEKIAAFVASVKTARANQKAA